MIKQITKVNPNTGKEYVGEIIVDTIGQRLEIASNSSWETLKSEYDYVTIYKTSATVNNTSVYSRTTKNKEELFEIAKEAQKAVETTIRILMEEETKGGIESELEKLGFKNNLEY